MSMMANLGSKMNGVCNEKGFNFQGRYGGVSRRCDPPATIGLWFRTKEC